MAKRGSKQNGGKGSGKQKGASQGKRSQGASAANASAKRRNAIDLSGEPLSLAGLPPFGKLVPAPSQLAEFEAKRDSYASGIGGDAEPVMGCVVRLDRGYPVSLAALIAEKEEELAAAKQAGKLSRREAPIRIGRAHV